MKIVFDSNLPWVGHCSVTGVSRNMELQKRGIGACFVVVWTLSMILLSPIIAIWCCRVEVIHSRVLGDGVVVAVST